MDKLRLSLSARKRSPNSHWRNCPECGELESRDRRTGLLRQHPRGASPESACPGSRLLFSDLPHQVHEPAATMHHLPHTGDTLVSNGSLTRADTRLRLAALALDNGFSSSDMRDLLADAAAALVHAHSTGAVDAERYGILAARYWLLSERVQRLGTTTANNVISLADRRALRSTERKVAR